jgi:hypothetical protein
MREKGGIEMKVKTGIIEFGERDWGNWITQLYFPSVTHTQRNGYQIDWSLISVRIDPKHKGYGVILLGFGIGMQKAVDKPFE